MADPVAESLLEYRKLFPSLESCVHLISHSLGCVPAKAKDDLGEFFELWQTKSITAWGDWLPEVDRAADRISKIISAPAGTVIMNQNVSTIIKGALIVALILAGLAYGNPQPISFAPSANDLGYIASAPFWALFFAPRSVSGATKSFLLTPTVVSFNGPTRAGKT